MASMDEAILKRVLPHSLEAEQSVIGSMIMDREAIVVASEYAEKIFIISPTVCFLIPWWN